jgi:hypothetical protein
VQAVPGQVLERPTAETILFLALLQRQAVVEVVITTCLLPRYLVAPAAVEVVQTR